MENEIDEKLLDYISKQKLSLEDIKLIIKQKGSSKPLLNNSKKLSFNSKRLKFGVISDTHMGHNKYRPDILEHAVNYFRKQKVEFVLHCGDILEGMSGREGHVYELDYVGASAQMDYAVEQLSKIEQPVYAITASNSHDGWFSSKNNMGLEVGPELERRVKNFSFIGYDEADVNLDSGLKIRMVHPGGGTAYAISYKMQKYLNAMSGGDKPHLLFQGHYHKVNYLFYRNVHAFDAGALEEQTVFMKKMQSPSMIGYWVVDAVFNKNKKEVDRVRPEFVPFY